MPEICLKTREAVLAWPMCESIHSGACMQLPKRSLVLDPTHNQMRDIREVRPNVGIEPKLQPLTGESFPLSSPNAEEGARLDKGCNWDNSNRSVYFNYRVFYSHTPSNNKSSTNACYRRDERERKENGMSEGFLRLSMEPLHPGPVHWWGIGTICNHCLQKTGGFHCCKARPIIQHDPTVRQVLDLLLAD